MRIPDSILNSDWILSKSDHDVLISRGNKWVIHTPMKSRSGTVPADAI